MIQRFENLHFLPRAIFLFLVQRHKRYFLHNQVVFSVPAPYQVRRPIVATSNSAHVHKARHGKGGHDAALSPSVERVQAWGMYIWTFPSGSVDAASESKQKLLLHTQQSSNSSRSRRRRRRRCNKNKQHIKKHQKIQYSIYKEREIKK